MQHSTSFKPALYVLGLLLTILGIAMVVPGLFDMYYGDSDWTGFFVSAAVTVMVGLLFALTNYQGRTNLTRRQAFLLTVVAWIGVTAFSALPFMFSRLGMTYTDAFFEAISGLTTTGSTVVTGLDTAPPGFLLWRSILQWLGGVGIVMMAIVLLPFLRVGGMQLFRMESSDTQDKVVSRVGELGGSVMIIYIGLTVICAVAYIMAGMTVFEAVNHAMTTVASGGYSTSDSSIGHFNSAWIQWIAIVFMIASGLPFVLIIRFVHGEFGALYQNVQVQAFVGFLVSVSMLFAYWLWFTTDMSLWTAVTEVTFNVVSVVTTTGFASLDYSAWGALSVAIFFALTWVGGCTGSTAGGVKIFRFQVAWKLFLAHVHKLLTPNSIEVRRFGERPITDDVAISVLLFFFIYVGTIGTITMLLASMGLDWVTAISGAATAVGNVGPGLGDIIGPEGNFKTLPDAAKWLLAIGMLLGRLEFFTVLVLFIPRFWRG